jgi:hypothetical protein
LNSENQDDLNLEEIEEPQIEAQKIPEAPKGVIHGPTGIHPRVEALQHNYRECKEIIQEY